MHLFYNFNSKEYSLFHRCAIYFPYPVHTGIAVQNEPAFPHLLREILYIIKCSAQMSLSPGSVSRSPSQKLIPPSSILPMLLSLDFYCPIFHIVHCITISNVGISSLSFYI